jgi:hypothetical protein
MRRNPMCREVNFENSKNHLNCASDGEVDRKGSTETS